MTLPQADRLVVRGLGSLYGPVRVQDLGIEGVPSSRNAYLASRSPNTYLPRSDRLVAENRASGIPAMIHELRRAGPGWPILACGYAFSSCSRCHTSCTG